MKALLLITYNLIISLLLLKTVCVAKPNSITPKKNFIYGTYEYDTRISVTVSNDTEQILDFTESDATYEGFPSRVHVSTNDSVALEHPVFITATLQEGICSWELPMVVQTGASSVRLGDMSRTLCPHDAGPDTAAQSPPTVHITSRSPGNTSVDIRLERVTDFYLQLDKEVNVTVSPSSPSYYLFSFEQDARPAHPRGLPGFNYTAPKSVILVVESDDALCATVSIQNNSCPVFDDEKEIMYQGYHLTMDTKGGITLTQSMFPLGFYVVFVVKESDAECTGASETEDTLTDRSRTKNFKFRIVATVSYAEYAAGALVLAALVTLVLAFVVLAALPFSALRREEELIVNEPAPSTSGAEPAMSGAGPATSGARPASEDTAPILDSEDDTDTDGALTVARLTRAPAASLARRSERYMWGALTLAVVYALPVVQLLFTYQRMVFQTGSQDLCYYNFLCAHPLGSLSDFNHVYSNVAYVLLGAGFLLQVRARQRCAAAHAHQEVGIPQHYGLLYAMGLALCMEGFLSACYHLCPNKMNFQFDSSFMYVIAVLVMLKLYQSRHSDLVPSAHATFMLIALVIAIGMLGILFPSVYFSVLFTILHLGTCLVLTLKIYYAGRSFKLERSLAWRAWRRTRERGWRALVPAYTARASMLALANLANWTFAILAAYSHNKDVARQLLVILMANAILYLWFYIGMKLTHGERPRAHAWLYCGLAHAAWALAAYQFVHGNTRWSETPAMSRRRNGACTVLALFDGHDMWHVSSAVACFLSYNLLLVIDDDVTTRRKHIHTF